MSIAVITTGTELLKGTTLNTNLAFLGRELGSIGLAIRLAFTAGDRERDLYAAFSEALDCTDTLIVTGGLGPTKDDITKKTLAEYFNSELVCDKEVYAHVQKMLEERGIEFNELNQGQALVPACCTVLPNMKGTAPGMWFERDGKVVVSLPGVPFEMEALMQEEVLPRLAAHFSLKQIVHRTMITAGLAESMLAKRIEAWENALPPYIKLAYLPSPSQVRLRLSAYEVDGRKVGEEIDRLFSQLEKIIPQYVVGYQNESIYTSVHKMLLRKGLTLATAESCTGGAIAAHFTSQAGASGYFLCGVVSYSNEAKHNVLGVDMSDIERYGAVSRPVVEQMAEGARRISGADYAVATSGIAGPTGGTPDKPVGTVWMAVATPSGVRSQVKILGSAREQVIERATSTVVAMLRDAIIEQRGE